MRALCIIIGFAWLYSCSPAIERQISKSTVLAQNHTGFYLLDPETDNVLLNVNGEKYFTPASNTKILTFYTSLNVLGDSIPALSYAHVGDSVILWGTGDPSFLHPDIGQGTIRDFLAQFDSIYFSSENFHDDHFGAGWAWDDFLYGFQPEKSPFPIYGNVVHLDRVPDSTLQINPPYFADKLQLDSTKEKTSFKRELKSNSINYYLAAEDSVEKDIPFLTDDEMLAQLLKDTLHIKVHPVSLAKANYQIQTLYSIPADSLYRRMMHVSDNFVAEQLMLMNAGVLTDTLATDIAIRFAKDSLLADSPDPLVWRDGSGLSRYNLFTPRSIVHVWGKIKEVVPEQRLYELIPAGGFSGTLEDWYKADPAFIYGKTGTLSNNHCLSGFIKTKRGNTLIFSFMNNNYRVSSATIKKEMERILKQVYEKY